MTQTQIPSLNLPYINLKLDISVMMLIFPVQTLFYIFCVGRSTAFQSEEQPGYRLDNRRNPCKDKGFMTT
jgi:hypothetical protein